MDVRDQIREEEPADLTVVRLFELDLVIGRTGEPDDPAGDTLGVAQVVQPSDNLVLPFGLMGSVS